MAHFGKSDVWPIQSPNYLFYLFIYLYVYLFLGGGGFAATSIVNVMTRMLYTGATWKWRIWSSKLRLLSFCPSKERWDAVGWWKPIAQAQYWTSHKSHKRRRIDEFIENTRECLHFTCFSYTVPFHVIIKYYNIYNSRFV